MFSALDLNSRLSYQNLRLYSQKNQAHQRITQYNHKLYTQGCEDKITVPIKQYSNKFLREKQKQQIVNPIQKTKVNHKIISELKKHKGKFKRIKNNKQNGENIILNLFSNQPNQLANDSRTKKNGILFDCENSFTTINKVSHQENNFFQKVWVNKNDKNQSYLSKKVIYDKICEKQKILLPQYRKKSKHFTEIMSNQFQTCEKDNHKISTSRALQKYSKIIKLNPEHGKIQKMKIKKQLIKSMIYDNAQKNQIQTKQITLSRKQTKTKSNFFSKRKYVYHSKNLRSETTEKGTSRQIYLTPDRKEVNQDIKRDDRHRIWDQYYVVDVNQVKVQINVGHNNRMIFN